MIDDSTPRSVGHGSPRDDRFYTPRTVARSNSNSNSEEWLSPRYETPRYGPGGGGGGSQFGGTPRSNNPTPRSARSQYSDEFETPRTFDADRKLDRRPSINRSNSFSRDYDQQFTAQGKVAQQQQQYDPYFQGGGGRGGGGGYSKEPSPPQNHQSPRERQQRAESKYGEQQQQQQQKQQEGHGSEEDYALDLAASGLSERDVEDVFSYARHGRCEEIERLFTKGLPVDVRDVYGNTVLIIACQNGNKRVAKAVLRRGANINSRNHKGNTPLHYCYHYGYGETLGQYLISKGADAEARNNAGKNITQGI